MSVNKSTAAGGLSIGWGDLPRRLQALFVAGAVFAAVPAGSAEQTPRDHADRQVSSGAQLEIISVPRPAGLAVAAGQATTQLPDGRWLVSGGASGRDSVTAQLSIFDPQRGQSTPLATRLRTARARHTATLLPDGTVLIHGGVDARGMAIEQTELVEIQSGESQVLAGSGLIARAQHTATVLSDGKVLIAGGVDRRGLPVLEAELYDPVQGKARQFSVRLDSERLGGTAALLVDDRVLISGGTDRSGRRIDAADVYDAQLQRFQSLSPQAARALAQEMLSAEASPRVVSNAPLAEASDVAVDARLMLHFSGRMNVASLNNATITLIGPNASTPVKVVPVERGSLLFVTPCSNCCRPASTRSSSRGRKIRPSARFPFSRWRSRRKR